MVDWTELRVAKLKLLHKKGLAAAAIAKKLGPAFTKSMVIGKIHRLASSAKAHPRMPAPPPPRSADPIVVPPPTLPRDLGVPEPSGRELFELRAGQCRFPLGDDRPARLFCGAPAGRDIFLVRVPSADRLPEPCPTQASLAKAKPPRRQSGRGAANNTAVWRAARDGSGPSLKVASDNPPDIALKRAAGVA